MSKIDDPDIIPLDLPARDGSNGYVNLFLRYYNILAMIMADSELSTHMRVNLMINLMIASVPDDDFRFKLTDLRNKLIEEATAAHDQDRPSVEEKQMIQLDANINILGEISGFIDLYMGTSKRIGVSVEAVYPESAYLPKEDEQLDRV